MPPRVVGRHRDAELLVYLLEDVIELRRGDVGEWGDHDYAALRSHVGWVVKPPARAAGLRVIPHRVQC